MSICLALVSATSSFTACNILGKQKPICRANNKKYDGGREKRVYTEIVGALQHN
jgi:hypothetical protein